MCCVGAGGVSDCSVDGRSIVAPAYISHGEKDMALACQMFDFARTSMSLALHLPSSHRTTASSFEQVNPLCSTVVRIVSLYFEYGWMGKHVEWKADR